MRNFILIFALAISVPAWASDDYSCTVGRVYYEDSIGRTIDYDFAGGTALPGGNIELPASSLVYLPSGEENAQYYIGPASWSNPGITWANGVYRPFIPQAQLTLKTIPEAAISIDGSTSDWSSVPYYCIDASGEGSGFTPSGSDVDYVKFAYTANNTRLACLLKLNDAASTDVVYRFFLDKNLDNSDGGVTDYQIDIAYSDNSWQVVSQGWVSENGGDWYDIDELGSVTVAGQYIEFSVDAAIFGLPAPVNIIGNTRDGQTYSKLDVFANAYRESEQCIGIGSTGTLPDYSGEWTFCARFKDFQNNLLTQHPYSISIGAASSTTGTTRPQLEATWFSGRVYGQNCEHALILFASVNNEDAGYEWEWNSFDEGLVITGLDPCSTNVDLCIDVSQNGMHVDFYYRINAGYEDTWIPCVSHDLDATASPMYGFPFQNPGISLYSEIMTNAYDLNGDTITNLADMAILARSWFSAQGQAKYNEACDLSDPADGVINYNDLMVIAENWLLP